MDNSQKSATAASTWRYRAFISYSHEDTAWAHWLHRALEHYVVPLQVRADIHGISLYNGRITPIFLDQAELAAAGDLNVEVRAALDQSQVLIVIASPAAERSPKVAEEIIYFKGRKAPRTVLALIVGGRPSAAMRGLPENLECFPVSLRFELDSAGTSTGNPAEPLAADVREGRSRRQALLKLVAGILGISFDALARRDIQRRNRRLAFVASFAAFGMLVTSALALAAWLAREEANQQRSRAEAEAQASRVTMEFLTAIFEAPTPEKALGRPVSARDLLDLGAKRLQTDLQQTPDIGRRLAVTIGRAYRSIGAYDRAQPLLEGAVAAYDALPKSGGRDQANALAELGDLYRYQAKPADAARILKRAIAIENTLPSAHRSISAWLSLARAEIDLNQRVDALSDLDDAARELKNQSNAGRDRVRLLSYYALLYQADGNYKKSIDYNKQALALSRQLFGADSPDVLGVLAALAVNYNNAGEIKAAAEYYNQEISISESIYGPEHPIVSTLLMGYAINQAEQERYAVAEPLFRRVLAMREKIFGPENINTAYALDNLAAMFIDVGRFSEALPLLQRSEAIYEHAEGPKHPDVAFALNEQSQALLKMNRPAEARAQAVRALGINEEARGDEHPLVARSLLRVAEADLAEHKYPLAVAELERGIKIADLTWHDSYFRMQFFLEDYAKALNGVGRREEAKAVLNRLDQLRAADAQKK